MNGRCSLRNRLPRPHPALAVAFWLALALGCGADRTVLLTESTVDVASEVDSVRTLPPPTGEAEPGAAELGTRPAPSEGAAPAGSSAKMPGTVPPSSDVNAPIDDSSRPDDAPARDTPIEGVFGNWCARMGVGSDDAGDACIDAAISYVEAVQEDCAVSGLFSGWSRDQLIDWGNYVIDYMYLFTGCPFESEPEEGALSVYGPAHLEPAGLPSPELGADDARRLSQHFTTALVTMLALTESDRAAVERVLAAAAAPQIGGNLSGVLSECAGNGPNASDAGAADAGR
jgi:hypothetical protein